MPVLDQRDLGINSKYASVNYENVNASSSLIRDMPPMAEFRAQNERLEDKRGERAVASKGYILNVACTAPSERNRWKGPTLWERASQNFYKSIDIIPTAVDKFIDK